ncbi:MAG: hypothetical protein KAS67_06655 [Thermoplasmata archaeon]|nr:hypothetical protein [Thermoplasmata archaeon]
MEEVKPRKLLITILVVIVLVIAGIYVLNEILIRTYYALHPDEMENDHITYITTFTASDDPALNKEITLTWKSEDKISGKIEKAEEPEFQQLILPESIVLIAGELRDIRSPGDDVIYSWTIKPIKTGVHYVKFGYCYYANESLVQNESLEYHEVSAGSGHYYSLYVLCLDIKEDSGEILKPRNVVYTNYTVSGNIGYSPDDSFYPLYTFKNRDMCWVNITVESYLDIPKCEWEFYARPYPSSYEYIIPKTGNINLTKGMNYFNYTIYMNINNLPAGYQDDDITVDFRIDSKDGWPIIAHPDGFIPAGYNRTISINLRIVD